MADKLRDARELEFLQARFIGAGGADMGKHEFASNMHRDTLNHLIDHPAMLQYIATGLSQTREQVRVQLLERMIRPAGLSPEEEGVGSGDMKEKLERQRLAEEGERLKHTAAKEKRANEAVQWGEVAAWIEASQKVTELGGMRLETSLARWKYRLNDPNNV